MAVTPIQSWPIPTQADVPNGPAQIQALADAAEQQSVMFFPDRNTRNAKIPSPTGGMVAWIDNPGVLVKYDGSTWRTAGTTFVSAPGIHQSLGTPDLGAEVFHAAAYVEVATGADGKFSINFPGSYDLLVSFQYSEADGGGTTLANSYKLYALIDHCSGQSALMQARNVDATGTALANKFVGFTYHAILQ